VGEREFNMAGAQIGAKEWLARNRKAMILCPHQGKRGKSQKISRGKKGKTKGGY
jgi:hypothetical protein